MKTRAYFFSFILAGALVLGACGKKAEEPAAGDTTAVENKMDSAATPAATTSETTTPAAVPGDSATMNAAGDAKKMADSAGAAADTSSH